MQKAFIFDLNGTLINDMGFHNKAWSEIINTEFGLNMTDEEIKLQMYGCNEEFIKRVFGENSFTPEEAYELGMRKERIYQSTYKTEMKLIEGLSAYFKSIEEKNIKLAIGSAASMFNIDFVLDHLKLRHLFPVVVSADDVTNSKPHPETFLKAAAQLKVAPENCIVFEDSPKGVEAAAHAGMMCVAITTMHAAQDFAAFDNVKFIISDYNDRRLAELLN